MPVNYESRQLQMVQCPRHPRDQPGGDCKEYVLGKCSISDNRDKNTGAPATESLTTVLWACPHGGFKITLVKEVTALDVAD